MVREWWQFVVENYSIAGFALMLALTVLFCAEVWIYGVRYSKIPKHRNRADGNGKPISVIVALHDPDEYYLEEVVPLILAQDYPAFELVVVDAAGDEFYTQQLNLLAEQNPKLVVACIARSKNIRLSDKVAFNIGIKTAQYENVLLTTTAAAPASNLWLASFGKAFECGASVVLGYSNMERKQGFSSLLMRLDIFTASVSWLSAAIYHHPYRGSVHNLGFTQTLYFDAGGFNCLNLQRGIEDLFVQRIANHNNTAVVTSPAGAVIRRAWGGADWWWGERVADDYPKHFYKGCARRANSTELIVRGLFFAAIIAITILMPLEIVLGALALYIIRLMTVMLSLNAVRRRLGEKQLIRWMPIYDFAAPLYELAIRIVRTLRPASRWR